MLQNVTQTQDKSPSKPTPPTKSSKQTSEKIWQAIFLLVTVITMVVSNKIYKFHTEPYFADKKKVQLMDLLVIGIPVAIVILIVDFLSHYLLDDWVDKNFLKVDPKYTDPETRKKRCYTLVRWAFNLLYYSWSSITAYILVKDSSIIPPFLGGTGSIYNFPKYRYLEQSTKFIDLYCCIQMGKHFARLFAHVFIRPQGSYYEYCLHHALATFLIFLSYALNMWATGLLILFIHDFSDIFQILGRGCTDYKNCNTYFRNFIYSFGFAIWVGLRILTFSYLCFHLSWYNFVLIYQDGLLSPQEMDVFVIPFVFMTCMLICLLIMQIYWTFFIARAVVGGLISERLGKNTYE